MLFFAGEGYEREVTGKAMPGLQKGQVALGLSDLSWGLMVGV